METLKRHLRCEEARDGERGGAREEEAEGRLKMQEGVDKELGDERSDGNNYPRKDVTRPQKLD